MHLKEMPLWTQQTILSIQHRYITA